eukprot:gene13490-18202_t
MMGMLISAVGMIGYMGIKQGAAQTVLLFPLPIIIIMVWRYTDSTYLGVSSNMSFQLAAEIDFQIHTATIASFDPRYYKQRSIDIPNGQIDPYRISDIPLLNEKGELETIYFNTDQDIRPIEEDKEPPFSSPVVSVIDRKELKSFVRALESAGSMSSDTGGKRMKERTKQRS